jgi:hypothetical protein
MSAGNTKVENYNNDFFGKQKLLMHPPQGGWCVKVAQTFGIDFCNVKNGATQYCKVDAENYRHSFKRFHDYVPKIFFCPW